MVMVNNSRERLRDSARKHRFNLQEDSSPLDRDRDQPFDCEADLFPDIISLGGGIFLSLLVFFT